MNSCLLSNVFLQSHYHYFFCWKTLKNSRLIFWQISRLGRGPRVLQGPRTTSTLSPPQYQTERDPQSFVSYPKYQTVARSLVPCHRLALHRRRALIFFAYRTEQDPNSGATLLPTGTVGVPELAGAAEGEIV